MTGLSSVLVDDVLLSPVLGVNPFEEALERLVYSIRLGYFSHGQRLPPERELSAQLGISRMTLRSVIRSLQETGYVTSKPGRYGGSFVIWGSPTASTPTITLTAQARATLLDAMLFRSVVEPGAAQLAAERGLTEDEQEELDARLVESQSASPGHFRGADARFHITLAALSGSPTLTKAVADVQMSLDDLLRAVPYMGHAIAHSHAQHSQIVRAVVARNGTRARSLMAEHIEATATLMRGFMSSAETEAQPSSPSHAG